MCICYMLYAICSPAIARVTEWRRATRRRGKRAAVTKLREVLIQKSSKGGLVKGRIRELTGDVSQIIQ